MKINFIISATALFVVSIITIPQLVNAQRIVSNIRGVRGLSTISDHEQTKKEMMDKIMNTIANMHPEDGVDAVDDRMLVVTKEKVDHIMESIDNVKDMLDSLYTDTDMNDMFKAVMDNINNKHGRHLQGQGNLEALFLAFLKALIDQPGIDIIVLSSSLVGLIIIAIFVSLPTSNF